MNAAKTTDEKNYSIVYLQPSWWNDNHIYSIEVCLFLIPNRL